MWGSSDDDDPNISASGIMEHYVPLMPEFVNFLSKTNEKYIHTNNACTSRNTRTHYCSLCNLYLLGLRRNDDLPCNGPRPAIGSES